MIHCHPIFSYSYYPWTCYKLALKDLYERESERDSQRIASPIRRIVRASAGSDSALDSALIVLYGSQARGDAESGSDIDVLVVLTGPVSPGEEIARTSEIIASLSLEHGVVLSRAFVSVDRFEHEQSPLLMNVRRKGIAV